MRDVDEKIKIVAGERIQKRKKSDEKSKDKKPLKDTPTHSIKISGGIKDSAIIVGTGNTISGIYNKSPIDKKEIHQTHIEHQSFAEKEADIQAVIDKDPSAHKQGRQALGWRKRGERVKPEFMTPKEYTQFSAQMPDGTPIWDGIERKFMRLNWEPWDWSKEAKADLPPVNRRFQKDRRGSWSISTGYDRRKPHSHGQRHEDIMSQRVRAVTLLTLWGILTVLAVLSFLEYTKGIN